MFLNAFVAIVDSVAVTPLGRQFAVLFDEN